jgi:hypothetical protein
MGIKVRCWTCYTCTYWSIDETDWSSEQPSIDFQTTQERQHYSSPGDGHQ